MGVKNNGVRLVSSRIMLSVVVGVFGMTIVLSGIRMFFTQDSNLIGGVLILGGIMIISGIVLQVVSSDIIKARMSRSEWVATIGALIGIIGALIQMLI